jgi:argininosuccinate lyase
MTSSDVLDTALALQACRALDRILAGSPASAPRFREARREARHAPMIGRSHGIHAEPVTAGLTFARWHAELGRARVRLVHARAAIAVGKIAGAVGVYGNLDPAIEAEALGAVGLRGATVATQVVARDRHAEVLGAIALLGTAIEQIALGVRHWQRTEVGEAEEGFAPGQKGSSAMPHKKNPILGEPDRARPPPALLRAGRARGRRAVARARYLALERRARRRCPTPRSRRLHARAPPRPSRLAVHPHACAQPRPHRRAVLPRPCCSRS